MFDITIKNKTENGILSVSKEFISFGDEESEYVDSISKELVSGKDFHVNREEVLVITLSGDVDFQSCWLKVKSKIALEVLCIKDLRQWRIREIVDPITLGGKDLPTTVNVTAAEDEED